VTSGEHAPPYLPHDCGRTCDHVRVCDCGAQSWVQLEADPAGWILCNVCGYATRSSETRLGAAGSKAGDA
jgi:hypothetical protein